MEAGFYFGFLVKIGEELGCLGGVDPEGEGVADGWTREASGSSSLAPGASSSWSTSTSPSRNTLVFCEIPLFSRCGLLHTGVLRNSLVFLSSDFISIFVGVILQQESSQGCPNYISQICADDIDILQEDNECFVACNDCAFPVCRTCYEYECQEGTQACPRCKTRYKHHKGMSDAVQLLNLVKISQLCCI
jgi:hypothetical protein